MERELADKVENLLVRGLANHPDFGWGGAQELSQLPAGAVYATLVPEGPV